MVSVQQNRCSRQRKEAGVNSKKVNKYLKNQTSSCEQMIDIEMDTLAEGKDSEMDNTWLPYAMKSCFDLLQFCTFFQVESNSSINTSRQTW